MASDGHGSGVAETPPKHEARAGCDAWHPGLESDIPARLMPLATLYRPENSTVDFAQAREAAAFCGLEPRAMVATRPERLVAHELLIRVTSDLSVPDGPNYEDLGISLRGMAAKILDDHLAPRTDEVRAEFEAARGRAAARLRALLDAEIFAPVSAQASAPAKPEGLFGRLFGGGKATAAPVRPPEPPEHAAIAKWRGALEAGVDDPFEAACLAALVAVAGGIVAQRGRLMADRDTVADLACNMVCNGWGGDEVGRMIAPIFEDAARAEGYRFLPVQEKPLFLNVKGASAAGKSTIRPAQRALAEELGVPWEDFALISPDYWRKFLLDYESLGEDYKYAAMLTGQELEIIDRKLDRYMEAKAARHAMPHLLIDRFRFDSFDASQDDMRTSRLLTRFGDTVFLFFMVTPPAETVERSWKRGLRTGRFKAVDDLLFHNIEAYSGMPNLFFPAVLTATKKTHFEFLDNDVPLGERPRTIAFGWNGRMTILDLARLNDIDRFRAVDIAATRPEEVLEEVTDRFAFLGDCLRRIPEVTLADHATGRVYGMLRDGEWVFRATDAELPFAPGGFEATCLAALGWTGALDAEGAGAPTLDLADERRVTLGAWGAAG
jgi:hypothetical protein